MSDFQEFENNSMEVALGAFGQEHSPMDCDIGDQPMTVPPNNNVQPCQSAATDG